MAMKAMEVPVKILLCIPLVLFNIMKTMVLRCFPKRLRYKDVEGETVLITGAGSGLGRELAIRFSKLGCRLVLVDINENGVMETKKMITENSGEVFVYQCDVSKRKAIYEMAEKIKDEVGNVTILVNNAGIVTGKKFLECPDDKIVKTFEVNTLAHFWTCKAFLPNMVKNNHGHIVAIASIAGLAAGPRLSDYCSSKSAAVGFGESLRIDLDIDKLTGIKSTVVCPYHINTGLFDGFYASICPTLTVEYVADEVISAVLVNQELLIVPEWFRVFIVLKWLLPVSALRVIADCSGVTASMDNFKGRKAVD